MANTGTKGTRDQGNEKTETTGLRDYVAFVAPVSRPAVVAPVSRPPHMRLPTFHPEQQQSRVILSESRRAGTSRRTCGCFCFCLSHDQSRTAARSSTPCSLLLCTSVPVFLFPIPYPLSYCKAAWRKFCEAGMVGGKNSRKLLAASSSR